MRNFPLIISLLIAFGANAQDSFQFDEDRLISEKPFNFAQKSTLAAGTYMFKEAWYLDAGYGTSLFLGDIAPQPHFTFNRNSDDYNLAYMFRFGKRISRGISFNIEFTKGRLRSIKEFDAAGTLMDLAFKGDYIGLTLNARFDVLKLLNSNFGLPVSFYVRMGGGPLYYRTVKTHLSSGIYWSSMGYSDDGITEDKRAQTSVVPIGLGIYYEFSDNLRAEFEANQYNATTDLLDAHHGMASTSNDKIILFTFNVQYTFDWDNFQAPSFNYY